MRASLPFTASLRTKFLLSLALISALLTTGVLLIVRYRVELHTREELGESLQRSVATFQRTQQLREATLQRSAALIATLPPLRAMMTSRDPVTIQDASEMFWQLAGSQVFVLVDRDGSLVALHASSPRLPVSVVESSVRRYLTSGVDTDWWLAADHLYQVFFQPIYFGDADTGHPIGMLAVGYEIDAPLVADLRRIAASDVAFAYDRRLVISTVGARSRAPLAASIRESWDTASGAAREVRLDGERFVATSVRLSSPGAPLVTLTVLKSFDAATAFLNSLNRWIVGIGIAGVFAGAILVFVVSTTFTRPLARLVSGVRALERGDYAYPLDLRGGDEVSALTRAFAAMRQRLQETQRQLLEAEQLATIGRLSSTISHDLRHPLTAIQAYAEFLADSRLTDAQRLDCYEEIRLAVNRMTDEINSLLAFSKEGGTLRAGDHDAVEVIERAIRTMKALPEFDAITVASQHDTACVGRFDPAKLERVMLNLLFNAGEAIVPKPGQVTVTCGSTPERLDIRVEDDGPGIPPSIAKNLFQPFVSYGKEQGIGLGLTVVHSIMQQHGGDVVVERTGPSGTVFRLTFPRQADGARPAGPVPASRAT